MRTRQTTLLIFVLLLSVLGCQRPKNGDVIPDDEDTQIADSTLYGICGQGTMMHTLELITNMRDTLTVHIASDDEDEPTVVSGGLMAGDRMAVTAAKGPDGLVAQRIVNITSLLGRWTSIDKDFEITDDGEVKSFVRAETNTWTAWRILNGQLLLNRDTFDIITLGADSLEMESSRGIYLFKRIRTDLTYVAADSLAGNKDEQKDDSL